MEATRLVMQCARAHKKHQQKSQSCFVKDGNIGTTPTNNVQGQLQLKWACLIKHLADEDIPKCKAQCQIKA